jgi:hypothetical protein
VAAALPGLLSRAPHHAQRPDVPGVFYARWVAQGQ